ncbi:MAG: cation:proton antiporter [Candidatus Eremiobacteraeota bacterium]|nr:cation:proton antiporter [Candidatus Eremiobacteraeota bacterium]
MKLYQIAVTLAAGVVVGSLRSGWFAGTLQNATLYVFLPALIFEAAWQLNLRLLIKSWRLVALLAVPGVAVTAAIVAAVMHFAAGMPLEDAMLLGAVLSATDPVAIVAIFRRLAVPPLLATIVEAESLLNDAVAVILYRSVVAVSVSGVLSTQTKTIALWAIASPFVGAAIGAAFGALFANALRERVPAVLQGASTFACAYFAYFLADRAHGSGIFAVVTLAIVMRAMHDTHASLVMVTSVGRAWSVAATVANATLFFLIGASVAVGNLWAHRAVVCFAVAATLAARAVVVYGLPIFGTRLKRSWKVVMQAAGIRGALSLALALGIPATVATRTAIVDATFAVVLLTMLLGTLTYERGIGSLDFTT